MEKTKIKHNKNWKWDREWTASEKEKFEKKEKARIKRAMNLKPKQQKVYVKSLLNRSQRKIEIKKQIEEIVSSEKNLALIDIQKRLGLHRNTFNYWIDLLEKEGWLERRVIKNLGGKDKRGQPKTLVLNTKKIEEMKKYSVEHSKNFEDKSMESYMLRSMFIMKILREIEEDTTYKQHKKLLKLFKQFKKDNYGAQMTFLLYSDFIKVDYKFSITDKGKKVLEKLKKKNPKS